MKRAKQLKKEKGILADTDKKKDRILSREVTQRIVDFCQSDEYSCMCPGKKE